MWDIPSCEWMGSKPKLKEKPPYKLYVLCLFKLWIKIILMLMPWIVPIQAWSKFKLLPMPCNNFSLIFGTCLREKLLPTFWEFSIKNKLIVEAIKSWKIGRPFSMMLGWSSNFPRRLKLSSRNLLDCFYFGFEPKFWPLLAL